MPESAGHIKYRFDARNRHGVPFVKQACLCKYIVSETNVYFNPVKRHIMPAPGTFFRFLIGNFFT